MISSVIAFMNKKEWNIGTLEYKCIRCGRSIKEEKAELRGENRIEINVICEGCS